MPRREAARWPNVSDQVEIGMVRIAQEITEWPGACVTSPEERRFVILSKFYPVEPNPTPSSLVHLDVSKTAIREGLASRIVAKEVPESLFDKRVLTLNLASIIAGTGICGQFESKFKALLKDIEEE
ncbi:hypothetical protein M422DRAFT_248591 [Sphaerobolus stellatus SS14]|nr:hypothetical protein M422DRAFT_248591 [Sphaerobolus stellatus SS14]